MATVSLFSPSTGAITAQDQALSARVAWDGVQGTYRAYAELIRTSDSQVIKQTPKQTFQALPPSTLWTIGYGQFSRNLPATPELVEGTTYTYRVIVEEPAGVSLHDSSQTLTFRMPPSTATVSPAGSGIGTSPTFSGTYTAFGGRTVTHRRIRVERVSDGATMWDSGWVSSTGSSFSTAYGGSPLAAGVQYRWRVLARDSGGYETVTASFQSFTVVANTTPVVTLTSPIGSVQVGTLTPTLAFGFSDADTDAVLRRFDAYQIQVRRVSDSEGFLDTGQLTTSSAQKSALAVSYVYDGDTLVNGTAYEWRARGWDGGGTPSAYTAWASFTPALAPNAPTITSPLGLTDTLTPDIEGTYSQGQGDVEDDFQYQIRQGSTTIYDSGDVGALIATGETYGGSPALLWGTSYQVRARSKDDLGVYSAWSNWVSFNTNAAPLTPSSLSPNGSITSDTTPTLSWTHNDPDGDAQEAAQVELRLTSDDSAVTGYDPKTLSQSTTTHDVTETLTDSPTEYKWRVRTRGTSGPGYGPWSDWVTFTVADAPVVSIDEPDPDDEYTTPAVLIEWSFSGGSGTQQDYRVIVYESNQATVVHDTGVVAGTDDEYTIPSGTLATGETYYVRVIARDTLSQGGQSSLVRFTTNWTPPDTVTGLNVVPLNDTGALPGAYLSWDVVDTSQSTFLGYRVYRRENGDSEWALLTTLPDRSVTAWADYTMEHAVTYEYTVAQFATIGADEIESAKASPVQASVEIRDMFIHDALSPTLYAWLRIPGQRVGDGAQVAYVQPWGHQDPTAHIGPAIGRSLSADPIVAQWHGDDAEGLGKEAWRSVVALMEAQTTGARLMVRQLRDVAFYCVLENVERTDSPGLYTITFNLRRVRGPQ